MKNTRTMKYEDFYFNGKYLSSFDWFIGSKDNDPYTISILPTRDYVVDRPADSDITYVFGSQLEPRTFEVSVANINIKDGDYRKFANWINSPTPSKFFFKGDDVYINCVLDSDAFDAETVCGIDGVIPLKFIAHDPYYYSMNLTTLKLNEVVSGQEYVFNNNSSIEVYPDVTVHSTGDVGIVVKDVDDNIVSSCEVTNTNGGFIMNNNESIITDLDGNSIENQLSGDYLSLPIDFFKVTFTGNVTKADISFRGKFL